MKMATKYRSGALASAALFAHRAALARMAISKAS